MLYGKLLSTLAFFILILCSDISKPAVAQSAFVGPDSYWIVVASRPDYDEAVEIATFLLKSFPNANVLESNNGWYAIVLGARQQNGATNFKNGLISIGSIPPDSFLSEGQNFQYIAWEPAVVESQGSKSDQNVCEKFPYLCRN